MPSLLVRSGSNWVPEKGIYVMQGGSWQQKMGYVYVNGRWVPLSGNVIYMEGYEAVRLIVERNSTSRVVCERRSDHLYMWAVGSLLKSGKGGFRTSSPIDLTPFTQIRVFWRSTGHRTSNNESRLLVQNSSATSLIRRFVREGVFDWREDRLDISDLRGLHHIAVENYIWGNNNQAELWVRQIYLV